MDLTESEVSASPPKDTTSHLEKEKSEECVELKHIEYKSMILSGNPPAMNKTPHTTNEDLDVLEKFLTETTETNRTERWNKLDRTMKIQKITVFVDEYAKENEQTDEEKDLLFAYLKDCIDKKRLMRVKDVVYDNTTDKLVSIPGLTYNKASKKYTIKNTDSKRSSVLQRLPVKKTKTLKKEKDRPKET